MGYSCDAAAGFTRDAIVAEVAKLGWFKTSNGMPGGGFWEVGSERADGAIVGTVWRPLNDRERAAARQKGLDLVDVRVARRGSFRINPDGTVARFPGLPADLLRRAEAEGARKYRETFGPHDDPDWREARPRIIACLDEGVDPKYLWDDLQALARSYQTDQKVAFLALPDLTAESFRSFLEAL